MGVMGWAPNTRGTGWAPQPAGLSSTYKARNALHTRQHLQAHGHPDDEEWLRQGPQPLLVLHVLPVGDDDAASADTA